jgi:hypothetical protein
MGLLVLAHPFNVLIAPHPHINPSDFEPLGFGQISRQEPTLKRDTVNSDCLSDLLCRIRFHVKYAIVYSAFSYGSQGQLPEADTPNQ